MLDIFAIRNQLNELPFRDGRRQVPIGRISEQFPPPSADESAEAEEEREPDEEAVAERSRAIAVYLAQLEQELQQHGLQLWQSPGDPDAIYAVQQLKMESGLDLTWMHDAVRWVAIITTVALEMLVPGLIGLWLDRQFGTWLLSLLGLALGVAFGLWHLVQMTRVPASRRRKPD